MYSPVINPLHRYGHLDEIWGLLKNIVPQFQLPELPVDKPVELEPKPESVVPESGLGDDLASEQPLKDGKVCLSLTRVSVVSGVSSTHLLPVLANLLSTFVLSSRRAMHLCKLDCAITIL